MQTPPANASSQSVVAYLKLGGLQGESQDAAHTGWIEVLSFSWGASRSGIAAGGGGAGKVSFSDFTIVKVLDKSSPLLAVNLASGKYLSSAVLELVRPDGQVFMDYKLSDLRLSAIQENAGAGVSSSDDRPMESISLNFSKIEYDYTPYGIDGTPGMTVTAGWDLKANRPLPPSTAASAVFAAYGAAAANRRDAGPPFLGTTANLLALMAMPT